MKKIINFLNYFLVIMFFTLPMGCCTTKKIQEVPAVQVEKTVIKDSLIYVKDTIFIPLPTEEKEVITTADSSHLETSLAKSDAWIDSTGMLNHTLKNKEVVYKYIYDTVIVTKTVTEYKEKPVIIEVEVEKPYFPKWSIILMVIAGLSLGYWIFKIYGFLKIRLF